MTGISITVTCQGGEDRTCGGTMLPIAGSGEEVTVACPTCGNEATLRVHGGIPEGGAS